ncbi:hypothetical protein GCM10011386_03570 [Parapedobacter defluvii]|uniref:Uncharacterized protein n=1 Tax=Parapedobacter defluvii TaxID=2045106 RepID=A0ABQ1KZ75_9SPHI|nr:hypothetical protein GCM10011386_03570 [Parapedobacter defluvii]
MGSEANLSEKSRWSLFSAYNRQSNTCYKSNTNTEITPINIVLDEALRQAQAIGIAVEASHFLKPEEDHALK